MSGLTRCAYDRRPCPEGGCSTAICGRHEFSPSCPDPLKASSEDRRAIAWLEAAIRKEARPARQAMLRQELNRLRERT